MRGGKQALMALVAMGTMAAPLSAQSSGWLDRTLERLGRTIERVVDNVGDAMDDDDARWTQAAEDFYWSGSLDRGDMLEIKGVNGDIRVVPSEGDEVIVAAEVRARRSDPNSVRIERVEHGDGLTFCAVYPTPERAREENRCAPGSRGQMSVRDNDVQVTFVVAVPEGAYFVGRTVNGEIEVVDIEADASLTTVNGDIDVSTTGLAEATTVNGSIEAEMGARRLTESLSFSTVNGSITVDLPNGIDADIDASWLNGSFDSDIPLRVQGRVGRRSAQGAFGDGGPEVELKTVNGSIRIR